MATAELAQILGNSSFAQSREQFIKHKDVINKQLGNLETDTYAWFCFVKLLNCNATHGMAFSNAWCDTVRNIDSEEERYKGIVFFADLFNFQLVRSFMSNDEVAEGWVSVAQLVAFERLATFLENLKETTETIKDAIERGADQHESSWAALLGIHVLKTLAVSQQITLDSEYSNKLAGCPCGKCNSKVQFEDNSMGHREVWHGSVDIIIGDTAFIIVRKAEEMQDTVRDSAFDMKRSRELEDFRSQLIAETITFAFLLRAKLTPLVCLSSKKMKIFMYDKKTDLLYEGSEMWLFDQNNEFKMAALVALWFVVNYKEFSTGVKVSHEKLGYTADFKSFVHGEFLLVYENKLQKGGCKHVSRKVKAIDALLTEPGTFKRVK